MTVSIEQLSCQELVELVTDYLEGALPQDDRARFDEHVDGCTGCREYLAQMRTTIEVTGALQPADLSSKAQQALLEAFRGWKER
jgi:anti-sigma factor RsiW